MAQRERRLAVVFADVSGSTSLYEAIGDQNAHRVIAGCLDCLRSTTIEFGGRAIKFIGDELLAVFEDPDAAVSAATEMQQRLTAQRASDPSVPAIRVGIATGPVLEDADDVFGDTVNLAARIVDIASAGQVLTTGQTVALLTRAIGASCRALRPMELRGIAGTVAICEVLWNAEATLTMVVDSKSFAMPVHAGSLVLSYNGKDALVDSRNRVVRVGRDPSNDLVVSSRTASRWHARIQLQQDNFVLVDESANGTYVHFDGKPEIHVLREQTLLVGRGLIGLGESTTASDAASVVFTAQ
jgi:class 3 adenylate cyclase